MAALNNNSTITVKKINPQLVKYASEEHVYFKNWHWVFKYLYYFLTWILFFWLSGPWTYQKKLVHECNKLLRSIEKIATKDINNLTDDQLTIIIEVTNYVEKYSSLLGYSVSSNLEKIRATIKSQRNTRVQQKGVEEQLLESADKTESNSDESTTPESKISLTIHEVVPKSDHVLDSSEKVHDPHPVPSVQSTAVSLSSRKSASAEEIFDELTYDVPMKFFSTENEHKRTFQGLKEYVGSVEIQTNVLEYLTKVHEIFGNVSGGPADTVPNRTIIMSLIGNFYSQNAQVAEYSTIVNYIFLPMNERVQLYSYNNFILNSFELLKMLLEHPTPKSSELFIMYLTIAYNASNGIQAFIKYNASRELNSEAPLTFNDYLSAIRYEFGTGNDDMDRLYIAVLLLSNYAFFTDSFNKYKDSAEGIVDILDFFKTKFLDLHAERLDHLANQDKPLPSGQKKLTRPPSVMRCVNYGKILSKYHEKHTKKFIEGIVEIAVGELKKHSAPKAEVKNDSDITEQHSSVEEIPEGSFFQHDENDKNVYNNRTSMPASGVGD